MTIKPMDKVRGQNSVISYLKELHANKNWPKALLFYGRAGVGKLFTALQYAKHINMRGDFDTDQRFVSMVDQGTHPDIHVFKKEEGSSSFKIGEIRKALEEAHKPRADAKKRVLIFGDIQDFPSHKQSDALLKTIEDGFEDTLFIFTVTDLDLVFPTLRSRTVSAHFSPLATQVVYDLLDVPEGIGDDKKHLAAQLSLGSLDRATRLVKPSTEESLSGFELRDRAFTLLKNLRKIPVHVLLKFVEKIPDKDHPLFFEILLGIVRDVLLIEEGMAQNLLNGDRLEDVQYVKDVCDNKTYKIFDAFQKLQALKDRRGIAFSHQLQSALLTSREGILSNDD